MQDESSRPVYVEFLNGNREEYVLVAMRVESKWAVGVVEENDEVQTEALRLENIVKILPATTGTTGTNRFLWAGEDRRQSNDTSEYTTPANTMLNILNK